MEGYFNYIPTEVKDAVDADVKIYGYGIEGLYHFMPEKRFVPFLAVGFGGIRYNPSGHDEMNKYSVDYGAGLKFFLTDDIALRADVRHILPLNDTYNDLLVSFGINFAFGGKKVALAKVDETPAPVEVIVDSDKDGVPDNLDKCPNTPFGVAVDKDGCPLDSDHDGVPDFLDKCPNTPAGAAVDKDGCSSEQKQEAKVVVTEPPLQEKVSIALNVEFDTAKAVIKKKYHDEIKKVADFMKAHPETNAVIEGHTDNVDRHNDPSRNIKLSQARADSIRQYLIDKFEINASRITAVGYGPSKPIASNDTEEGRKKNRRVQAVIEAVKTK
jgi:OOP family OmpA-OmpF porin